MQRDFKISLSQEFFSDVVYLSQYDSNYGIVFHVTDKYSKATDIDNMTAHFQGLRSDGLGFQYTSTASSDTVTFTIDTALTAVAGTHIGEIVFYDGNGLYYGSANVQIVVEPATHTESTIDADVVQQQTLKQELQEIVNTAATTVEASLGTLSNLTTTDKSSAVAAINEVVSDVTQLNAELTAIEVTTNIDITTNGFVDTSGRMQNGDGTWKRSRYIPIDSINKLECSFWAHRAVLNISFWTESFTFISGLGNTTRPAWGHASSRTYKLDPTDIPSNAVYLMYCTSTSNSNNYCTVTLKSHEFDLVGKKYACLGDSITSDQVVGIGTLVNDILNTKLVGNFACGYAICSNWHTGDTDESPQTFVVPQNTNTADNVLMNQVLRLLQWTTALDAQVTWTHPVAGAYSVPTSIGTGLGHTDDIPDVIYIAIGVNDGRNAKNLFVDDSDAAMSSAYADLTKCSYASALRWAIETLNSAYPNAQIFVASPLFTNENDGTSNGHHNRGAIIAKRKVSKKIANYCNAFFIDSTYESGYTVLAATQVNNIHPNGRYKSIIGRYVANEIKRRYVRR